MADVDNGDILRIGASWLLSAIYEIANVYHVQVTSGGGIDYDDAIADVGEYLEDIYTEIEPQLSSAMAADHFSLANLTQDTTVGAQDWAVPQVGDAAGDFVAPGVALLSWARTLTPRVQSRKYWGVFGEAFMGLGLWSGTVQTACEAAHQIHAGSFVGTNGLTIKGVAYNRTLETITQLTTVTSTLEPAYQRRRKRGRGS